MQVLKAGLDLTTLAISTNETAASHRPIPLELDAAVAAHSSRRSKQSQRLHKPLPRRDDRHVCSSSSTCSLSFSIVAILSSRTQRSAIQIGPYREPCSSHPVSRETYQRPENPPSPAMGLLTLPMRLGHTRKGLRNGHQTDVMRPHLYPSMTTCYQSYAARVLVRLQDLRTRALQHPKWRKCNGRLLPADDTYGWARSMKRSK